jgi:glutathione S-transferase
VPVLQDEEKTIWDSRQIFQHLNQRHHFQTLSWQDENLLTAIEGALNSGVTLLLMKRSGMNVEENYMYTSRQKDRIESVLDFLNPYLEVKALQEWNFAAMTLYAFLDWGLFRKIFSIEKRPECKRFLEQHAHRPEVIATNIPKG